MVQQVRPLTAFQVVPGQSPAPKWRYTAIYNSSFKGLNALFNLFRH